MLVKAATGQTFVRQTSTYIQSANMSNVITNEYNKIHTYQMKALL